jgi:hypothetical protein
MVTASRSELSIETPRWSLPKCSSSSTAATFLVGHRNEWRWRPEKNPFPMRVAAEVVARRVFSPAPVPFPLELGVLFLFRIKRAPQRFCPEAAGAEPLVNKLTVCAPAVRTSRTGGASVRGRRESVFVESGSTYRRGCKLQGDPRAPTVGTVVELILTAGSRLLCNQRVGSGC